jgi:hypothetical protein
MTFTMVARLMRIPRELREQILGLCLVVDGSINPQPAHYEDKDAFHSTSRKPDMALLQVNQTINTEARRIFYGRNLFRLKCVSISDHVAQRYPTFDWSTLGKRRHLIHHLSTSFDIRVTSQEKKIPDGMDRGKNSLLFHEMILKHLGIVCGWKNAMVRNFDELAVVFDVANLLCLTGYCRKGVL